MNVVLARCYGGVNRAPHPHARYTLHFDGYRNIGWSLGGLAGCESAYFAWTRDLLRRKRATCAWDIGANVGLWSLFLADIEPPIQQIVAFEPDPINQRFLLMNQEKNGIDRLQIRTVALSAQPGTATFYADGMTGSTGSLESGTTFIRWNYGARPHEVRVQVSTIDAEVENGLPPPQFIKIDVEGHELSVLRGAAKTLATHRPAIMIEVIRNHDEVSDLLRAEGYLFFNPETGQPIERMLTETACLHASEA